MDSLRSLSVACCAKSCLHGNEATIETKALHILDPVKLIFLVGPCGSASESSTCREKLHGVTSG